MNLFSFARTALSPSNTKSRNRKFKSKARFNYEELESKNLLAGIVLTATGDLVLFGGDGNDTGSVTTSGTTLTANITGVASQDFAVSDISKVIFIGLGGNDRFTNSTSIDSDLIGNAGNDVLTGGSGVDFINGGVGNDTIAGNDGDDFLIGDAGDDTVRGGDGDDIILGGDGTNELFGEGQDDLIFGGSGIDEIFGGDGRDVLVGFAGDDFLDTGNGGTLNSPGTDNADLALGLEGNDELTGGTGLNVLYGGNGDDIITGGSGQNRLHGQNGDDTLTGGGADDFIAGQGGNDTINGQGGNDYIIPGQGEDLVSAGTGFDRAVFPSTAADYSIFEEGGTLGVSGFGQGFDRLTGFASSDSLVFTIDDDAVGNPDGFLNDATQAAVSAATRTVTIRPIVVADNNGSNRATHFGNAEQQLDTRLLIDQIYAAAGIDIVWEATRNWNNSAANVTGAGNVVDQLQSITEAGDAAGIGSANTNVIDMYFVSQAPGSSSVTPLGANGFAFIDFSGIAFRSGETLVSTPEFREVLARIAAHEIGHNLGLTHVSTTSNLLNSNPTAGNLNSVQIGTIERSQFASSVSALTLAGSGEALLEETVPSTKSDYQVDSTVALGGCGGCGTCAACMVALN